MEAGLVDHVVGADAPDLVEAAVSFARKRLPQVAGGLDASRTGGRLLKVQFQEQKFPTTAAVDVVVRGGSRCEGTDIAKIQDKSRNLYPFVQDTAVSAAAAPRH